MTLSTTKLANNQVLVSGKDFNGVDGKTVLDGTEWAQIKLEQSHSQLHDEFDDAVNAFFAPLAAAAEKLEAAHQIQTDPAFYITLNEGTEGVEAQPKQVVALSHDSVVLRLFETGAAHQRLLWVNDELVITEAPAAATPSFGATGSGDPYANVNDAPDFEPTA